MIYNSFYISFLAFIALLACAKVNAADQNISIPLNKTLTANNKELYGEFVTIDSNSTIQITVTDINKKISFIVIQVHSHLYNVTIKNITPNLKSTQKTGTNIGMYGTVKPPDTYYVANSYNRKLKLYISVHGYGVNDPIPGGCNTEFELLTSPFMHVYYTKHMIRVEAASPQYPADVDCHEPNIHNKPLKFYRLYLTEWDLTENSYFEGIKSMITWENIQKHGEEVPMSASVQLTPKYLRRSLGSYLGTGSIYVAVAHGPQDNESFYSIYVPSHTYACSPIDGCSPFDGLTSEFFCAGLLFLGVFTCMFGHRFFKTEMFLVGTFAGIIISYLLIPLCSDLETPALLCASLFTGVLFGAIWLLFWWFYGMPLLSVILFTLQLGFMLAAIIYYGSPGGHPIIEDDGPFWSIFVVLIVLTSVTLATITYMANILCCAVLGAYVTIFAMDHYIGSNLRYIVINIARRIAVEDFQRVVVAPPFQWKDILATIFWALLAIIGFSLQHYQNRGRPPFPPPPRSSTRASESMIYGAIDNRGQRYSRIENGVDSTQISDERSPLLDNM